MDLDVIDAYHLNLKREGGVASKGRQKNVHHPIRIFCMLLMKDRKNGIDHPVVPIQYTRWVSKQAHAFGRG